MTGSDFKADLQTYLQDARDVLLWKLEGLSEYDIRRPLTPTGTNLLGLVKHLAGAEAWYFGATFGRPFDGAPGLWFTGDTEPNGDLWARADETRAETVGVYRRIWTHSDETITALPLDAVGWLPADPPREITLHRVLTHMVAETQRHAGHADIVRELVDGATGQRADGANMAPGDAAARAEHRDRVERAAEEAGRGGR
ncbi:DinB family protein [Streptomyces sp. NPDC001833]|uniref:DinB family protein n=1 Tax=Streptomyces sp. NPDC001833 TaxID=3154658 RepID=UPI00331892E5